MFGVQVELDKPRMLRLTVNSVSLFDEISGTSFMELTDQLEKGKLNISQVRTLIWAMLLHENEDLTIAEAGNLMQAGIDEDKIDLAEIMEKMTLAVINFLTPRKQRGEIMRQLQSQSNATSVENTSNTSASVKKNSKKKSAEE